MCSLYKQKVNSSLRFVDSVSVPFIDLKAFAKEITGLESQEQQGTKELKIFFESEVPNEEAELFLNIIEKEYWFEI